MVLFFDTLFQKRADAGVKKTLGCTVNKNSGLAGGAWTTGGIHKPLGSPRCNVHIHARLVNDTWVVCWLVGVYISTIRVYVYICK